MDLQVSTVSRLPEKRENRSSQVLMAYQKIPWPAANCIPGMTQGRLEKGFNRNHQEHHALWKICPPAK
jgi:hypothetical protein